MRVCIKVGGDLYWQVHSYFYISGQPAAGDRSEQEKQFQEEHSHQEPSGTLRNYTLHNASIQNLE